MGSSSLIGGVREKAQLGVCSQCPWGYCLRLQIWTKNSGDEGPDCSAVPGFSRRRLGLQMPVWLTCQSVEHLRALVISSSQKDALRDAFIRGDPQADVNVARARARDLLKSIHCVGDASVPAADMHLTLDQGGRALAHGRSH